MDTESAPDASTSMHQDNITDRALARLREMDKLLRHPEIGRDSTGRYRTELTEDEALTGDLTVSTHNIERPTAVKLHHLLYSIRQNAVDDMILIDAMLLSQQREVDR